MKKNNKLTNFQIIDRSQLNFKSSDNCQQYCGDCACAISLEINFQNKIIKTRNKLKNKTIIKLKI
jgi:DNA-directed RNA polymerase alpha subunit